MQSLLIFFLSFYILLISIIGYGKLFENLCFGEFNKKDDNLIYTGFYGLMFVTLISLITSYFIPHNFYHNLILHGYGFFYLFFNFNQKDRNYLKYIFYISLFTVSALMISKTNDDFSYYHFPFTKYLTEQKIIFGMGNLNHGFNLLSSLFFLNSTFYLPFINFFSFHFSLLYFLIFFNYFVLKEIFNKTNDKVIKYLYLFSFIFFNLSFNRIAEYGTDKAGQLLIVILTIQLFKIFCFDKRKNSLENILYLLPLFGFCITLKTYFLPYILLSLILLFINNQIQKNFTFVLLSKSFLFLLFLLSLIFSHHFISTGCLISPIALTCFGDYTTWGREINDIENLSIWLEQWAKAGAGPGFRINDPLLYIQNLNWLGNWIDRYFLGKFTDQIGILFSCYIIVIFLFIKLIFDKSNYRNMNKIVLFYSLLLIVFTVWFLKHPTLRYGGYSIFFLTMSLPIAFIFSFFVERNNLNKKMSFLIIIVVIIFNIKNFNRINNEFKRNDIFKFSNFPFFAIKNTEFTKTKFDSGLTIYKQTNGHCWGIPSPCGLAKDVDKKGGYYFIQRIN
tara:strand:- start:470 stop:2152 length:1683 start_codon:yes stop_codon:yes gene_type:complete